MTWPLALIALLVVGPGQLVGERYCPAAGEVCVFDEGRPPIVTAPDWGGRWSVRWDGSPIEARARRWQGLIYLTVVVPASHDPLAHLELVWQHGALASTVARDWQIRVDNRPGAAPESAVQPPIQRVWAGIDSARGAVRKGKLTASIEAWIATAELAESLGYARPAARCRRAAAAMLRFQHRYAEALKVLDRAIPSPVVWGTEGPALRYRATILARLNRHREATHALARASDALRRDGLFFRATYAQQNLAAIEVSQGQFQAALRRLATIAAEVADDRAQYRGDYLNNVGWALAGWQSEGGQVSLALMERVLRLGAHYFEQAGNVRDQANALTNLAWAAHLDQQPARAQAILAEADAIHPRGTDYNGTFADLLEAEIHLSQHHLPQATELFTAIAQRFSAHPLSEPVWRATYGLARVALAEHNDDLALLRLNQALAHIEDIARHAELTAGRGQFFDARRALVDDALALLLRRGLVAQAFGIADAAQARVVRAFEAEVRTERLPPAQRAEWQRRIEAYLAQRAAFEAGAEDADLLPPDRLEGWRAERATQAAALTQAFDAAYAVLDEAEADAQAPMTLAEVQAALKPAERLLFCLQHTGRPGCFVVGPHDIRSFTVDGDLRAQLDLAGVAHLFIIGGLGALDGLTEQLVATTSVSRLPHTGFLRQRRARPTGAAVVVADPSLNLPQARAEAAYLDATQLVGQAATRTAVLAALPGARLLHFAGHGVLAPDAPWDAHLLLANDQRLTLADLLVARPHVGTVVLSGCDTGKQLALGHHDAVGLPTGFLSAGAHAVLATTRPIGDGEPQAFLRRFYAAGGASTPGAAFRRAAQESEAAGDQSWRAFRLFGLPWV